MMEIYINQEHVTRDYELVRQKAAREINKAALALLGSTNKDGIKLGLDWKIIKKSKEQVLYLQSEQLKIFCKIQVKQSEQGIDKRKYIHFNLKHLLGFDDDGHDWDKEVEFDLSKRKIEDLFNYSDVSLRVPFELIENSSEQELKNEMQELLAKAAKKYSAIEVEDFDLPFLRMLFRGEAGVKDSSPPYAFTSQHLPMSICAQMLGLDISTYELFELNENEKALFDEDRVGKNFSAGFDYLFSTLNTLGHTDKQNQINYNASNDDIYLLTVANRQVMCSTSQNGGWITVKGDNPGDWQCYNIIEPFDSAEKLMTLGPDFLKPSLIIENYEVKLIDSFAYYCQYAIWGACCAVREEMVEKKLLAKNAVIEPENFIPELAKKIEEENAIKLEKEKLQAVIKEPNKAISGSLKL